MGNICGAIQGERRGSSELYFNLKQCPDYKRPGLPPNIIVRRSGPSSRTTYTLFYEGVPETEFNITIVVNIITRQIIVDPVYTGFTGLGFDQLSTGVIRIGFQYESFNIIKYLWEISSSTTQQITVVSVRNLIGSFLPPTFTQPPQQYPQLYIYHDMINENNKKIDIIDVEIIDYFKYEKIGNCLRKTLLSEPTISMFTIKYPQIELMLWICGCTLTEKIRTLLKFNCGKNVVINNLIPYAVIKYVLSGIMYGSFDLCYLCRDFDSTFIKDLECSRFNNFTQLFVDCRYKFIGCDEFFIYCE